MDTYAPETFACRLSVKLFDCTPGNLPADLREQLISWMVHSPAGEAPSLGARDPSPSSRSPLGRRLSRLPQARPGQRASCEVRQEP